MGTEVWVVLLLLLAAEKQSTVWSQASDALARVVHQGAFRMPDSESDTAAYVYMPITPARFRRLKQGDHDFEAGLDYTGNYRSSCISC